MTSRIPKRFTYMLGFCFAVEGSLYSAVTPILPLLSRDFRLSDTASGILLSGYSGGLVIGALLCIAILDRLSPRMVTTSSMVVLGITTAAFAWADSTAVLMSARLLQGVAAGICWTGCVSWLLEVWPGKRRGEALGSSMSFAVFGTVAGPLIGTIALELGIRIPYTVTAILCVVAAGILMGLPRPQDNRSDSAKRMSEPRLYAISLARKMAVAAAAIAAVARIVMGAVNLLGSFVLEDVAGTDMFGGYTFVAAAVIMIAVARPMGILVDRIGAQSLMLLSLVLLALFLPVLGSGINLVVTIVSIILLVVTINLVYISAGTTLTRTGEEAGWPLPFTIALIGVVWGVGETAGAIMRGVGRDTIGSFWTAGVSAAVAAAAAILVVQTTKRKSST